MIDPVLAFLVASGGVAIIQAMRGMIAGRVRASAGSLRGECIAGIVVDDVSCIEENIDLFEKIVEALLGSDAVLGVIVGKRSVDRRKLIESIENKIMTLRVVLEREPGNKRVERRLRVLERMYEKLMNGHEYVEAVIGFLVDRCRGDAESLVVMELRRLGCRTRIVGFEDAVRLASSLRRGSHISTRAVARGISASIGVGGVELGVYIGRRRDGTPYMLSLRGVGGSRHYVVVGPTGRGKTTLAALILARASVLDTLVYGIDPKGDLARYASVVLEERSLDLAAAVSGALSLYREGLATKKLVLSVFESIGVNLDADTLEELVEGCETLGAVLRGAGRRRARRLGILSVTACSPLACDPGVVYKVADLPEALKSLAAVALLLCILRAGRGAPRLVVVDEAWRLGKTLEAHLVHLYKEARSAGLSIVSVTQDPGDLPQEVYNNSYGVIVFGSNDSEYVARLAKRLGLNEKEASVVRSLGVGEALVKIHGRRAEIVEVDAEGILGAGLS